jgi:hypothetical protein
VREPVVDLHGVDRARVRFCGFANEAARIVADGRFRLIFEKCTANLLG